MAVAIWVLPGTSCCAASRTSTGTSCQNFQECSCRYIAVSAACRAASEGDSRGASRDQPRPDAHSRSHHCQRPAEGTPHALVGCLTRLCSELPQCMSSALYIFVLPSQCATIYRQGTSKIHWQLTAQGKLLDPVLSGSRFCCSTPCRCSRWELLMGSIICKLMSSSQGPKQSRVKGRNECSRQRSVGSKLFCYPKILWQRYDKPAGDSVRQTCHGMQLRQDMR